MKQIDLEQYRDTGWNVISIGPRGGRISVAHCARELAAFDYRDKHAPGGIVLPPVGYPFERGTPYCPYYPGRSSSLAPSAAHGASHRHRAGR